MAKKPKIESEVIDITPQASFLTNRFKMVLGIGLFCAVGVGAAFFFYFMQIAQGNSELVTLQSGIETFFDELGSLNRKPDNEREARTLAENQPKPDAGSIKKADLIPLSERIDQLESKGETRRASEEEGVPALENAPPPQTQGETRHASEEEGVPALENEPPPQTQGETRHASEEEGVPALENAPPPQTQDETAPEEVSEREATASQKMPPEIMRALYDMRVGLLGEEISQAALETLSAIALPPAEITVRPNEHSTLRALQAGFPRAARAALKEVPAKGSDGTRLARFGAFLRSQVVIRSLSPRLGDDADAVLSRTEAALKRGEIEAALKEIATLPPPALQAMSSWRAAAARYKELWDAFARYEKHLLTRYE